ncbi:tetratricopeptide repeat protein [Amycolatopsis plumensis]|uniref:Tetratricopeptide repeat protein n=1 Tax=Amycolatopsis plumensis TaxID=236508 RepID=A0ABV5TX80_9PSEU
MGLFSKRPKALPADLDRRARAAGAMFDAGQFAAAELSLSSLVADCETTAGPEHPGTLAVLDLLGSTQFQRERLPESAVSHREARRRAVAVLGPDHPETLKYGHNLGCTLSMLRAWDEGLPVLRDVLTRRTRKLGERHPDTIDTAKTLGAALYLTGDKQAAATTLQAAYHAAMKAFGSGDPLTQEVAHNLEIVLRHL